MVTAMETVVLYNSMRAGSVLAPLPEPGTVQLGGISQFVLMNLPFIFGIAVNGPIPWYVEGKHIFDHYQSQVNVAT